MPERVADPTAPAAVAPRAGRRPISLTVNGSAVDLDVAPDRTLLDVLRGELGLAGTKTGCAIGVCGACSVLVDGRLQSACLLLIGLLEGQEIETIEGLGTPASPSPMQVAFVEAGGFQCGICTPGQVVAATALLREIADPSEETICRWLAGNLCRCTGYASIVDAVQRAARPEASPSEGDTT